MEKEEKNQIQTIFDNPEKSFGKTAKNRKKF